MKKVLFLLVSIVILGLVFAGCGGITNITAPSSTVEQGVIYLDRNGVEPCQGNYPLYAGQDSLVGEVIVTDNGVNLCVEYVLDQNALDEGWLIYETHIAVGADVFDIPQTKPKKDETYGNPKVGNFPYGDDDLGGVPSYMECGIPIPDVECGTPFVIAAHAVVKKLGDLEGLDLILPDQVFLAVSCPPAENENGYFDVTISGGTVLDGIYEGWCIDIDNEIDCPDVVYEANVYSSYEEGLPECLVENPENLDLVNWILNQNYIGEVSGCDGHYTMGDIQRAIWELLEGDEPDGDEGEGDWLQCRVDEIITNAMAYGEGFEPSCGEKAAVILAPIPECAIQIIIIMVDVPCEGDETAWAAACEPGTPGSIRFVKQGNWATYFTYIIPCEEVLVETVTVSSTDGSSVCSAETLVSGQEYRLEASGTFTYNSAGDWADAEWYLKNGIEVKGDSEGSQPYVLDISINGFSINTDWGEYNSAHIYSQLFTGTGSPICFSIYDSAYGDNSGSLTVDIYLVP